METAAAAIEPGVADLEPGEAMSLLRADQRRWNRVCRLVVFAILWGSNAVAHGVASGIARAFQGPKAPLHPLIGSQMLRKCPGYDPRVEPGYSEDED